jgi:isopentenyl-diphosphate delta-isomerase
VDEADREVGHMSKAQCHQGRGVLHRAFSLLIFNAAGELLLQQRSRPNGCGRCTGRTAAAAIRGAPRAWRRRFTAVCTRNWDCAARCIFCSSFSIRRNSMPAGAEHELCSVFIGRSSDAGSGQSQRGAGVALDRIPSAADGTDRQRRG